MYLCVCEREIERGKRHHPPTTFCAKTGCETFFRRQFFRRHDSFEDSFSDDTTILTTVFSTTNFSDAMNVCATIYPRQARLCDNLFNDTVCATRRLCDNERVAASLCDTRQTTVWPIIIQQQV